uniref:Uncharacterized protein n=1 Tax=Seriola lalandi dorsalis TaxID=1841481 RepID=A0A3B4WFY0_SERLL
MIPYTVNIKLAARTLTGTLNLQNKTAVDWGWQGLIAQGCHSSILIIDPKTSQTIQVLERHKANVVKVMTCNHQKPKVISLTIKETLK